MAMSSSETLAEGSIHQQIINSTDSNNIPVSTSEVLGETGEDTSLQQPSEGITTIASMEVSENIATVEAIVAVSSDSEGISVGTQVITDVQTLESVDNGDQSTTTLQMGAGDEQGSSSHTTMGISALPQSQETLTIDSQENNIISTESAIVSTVADTVSVLAQSQGLALVPTNMPPWAGRLRDCEMIGDSYRGYVTNEVELDLILTLHKQHTSTCWGTRQSPSSAKPSIRLMWRSQYVPYDGIPFLNTGRRATVMECQYGPRRKGNINKKQVFHEDTGIMSIKKLHRPTCPARIYIKKVRKFPEFRIDPSLEGKNVRQAQERALTALRLAGIETGGEERFYVQLPLPIAHEYHDVDDIPIVVPGLDGSPAQRLDPKVADKVQELVARGVTGIYTVKHCLKEYVEKELFVSQECPPRHNKAFFPTIIDIQNHIHTAQMALASGTLLPLPPVRVLKIWERELVTVRAEENKLQEYEVGQKVPLTNLPVPTTQSKERTSRKRKSVTDKQQAQGSHTQYQAAEAVASIQQTENAALTQQQDQVSEDMLGDQRQQQQQDYQQQFAEQLQQVQATTAQQLGTGQPQILISTPNSATGRQDGQVVIVVTNNNMYAGQSDGDVPTTLSLGALQSSQLSSLASVSFETAVSGGQTVTYLPQTLDSNIQLPTSDGYIAQPQAGSILTVLDPRETNAPTPVLGSVTATETVQLHMTNIPSNASGASAAVINVATAIAEASRVSPSQLSLQSEQGHEATGEQGEPVAKRPRTVVLDLASLVKEAVFDTQQEVPQSVQNVNPVVASQQQTGQMQGHGQVSQLVTMETQSVALTTSQINAALSTEQDLRGNVEAIPVTMTTVRNENTSIVQSSNEPALILAADATEQKSTDFNSGMTGAERLVVMATGDPIIKLEPEERVGDSRVVTTPRSANLANVSEGDQPTLFSSEQIDQRSVNHGEVRQSDTSNEATHFVNSDNLQRDLQANFEQQSAEQQGLSENSSAELDTAGVGDGEPPVCSEGNFKRDVTSSLADAATQS